MALIKCEECGKDVSSRAAACPHCGIKQVSENSKLIWKLFVAVVVVGALMRMAPSVKDREQAKIAAKQARAEKTQKRERASKVSRKTPSSKWKELSGNIWTGVKVYEGNGSTKSLAFEVLGGSEDCKTISSGRGLFVKYKNGSKEWKDRSVMINLKLFVKKHDPAINRMAWEVYNRC